MTTAVLWALHRRPYDPGFQRKPFLIPYFPRPCVLQTLGVCV